MRTISAYVVARYFRRYGVIWTIRFLVQYGLSRKIMRFQVPGFDAPFIARKNSSDVRVFNQVIMGSPYRLPVSLDDVKTIVDGGANVGFATRYFASVYPKAKILAIEPDRDSFMVLKSNVNAMENIRCFHGAVWPTATKIRIANPDAPKTAIKVTDQGDGVADVETITLSQVVDQMGTIDILKLDIEGAEVELFQQADLSWINNVRCLIIELHDFMRAGCSEAFYRAINGMSFQQYQSGENLIIYFGSPKGNAELKILDP